MSCNNRRYNPYNPSFIPDANDQAYTPDYSPEFNPDYNNTVIPEQNTNLPALTPAPATQSEGMMATDAVINRYRNARSAAQAELEAGMAGPSVMPTESELPETLAESIYTPGYLRNNIGNLCRVEFLIGNNTTDRVGILREVGASYIVLDSLEADSRIMCDLYAIKFVTIIGSQLSQALNAF